MRAREAGDSHTQGGRSAPNVHAGGGNHAEKGLQTSFRLAYVLWCFPRLSETFVVNEVYFLKRLVPDLQLFLFSVKREEPRGDDPLVRAVADQCLSLPPRWWLWTLIWCPRLLVGARREVARVVGELRALVRAAGSLREKTYAFLQVAFCAARGVYFGAILRGLRIGHVHTHFAESGGLIAFVAARLAGIPFSLTLHGHDIYFNPNPALAGFLIERSRFAVTVSEFNRRHLVQRYPHMAGKIRVVHCGIDLELFRPRAGGTGEGFRIVSVARLQPRKGIADLVEACRALSSVVDFQCVVIGDGPQRRELEEKVASYGLQRQVKFAGACSQSQVLDYLAQASVFVLPSYSEGIPVSVMEAMAVELPVVVTRVNGVPELVGEGAGILVAPGDVDSLAAALRTIAGMSSQERRLMGAKGRAMVAKGFDIRTQIRILGNLFLTAASGAVHRRACTCEGEDCRRAQQWHIPEEVRSRFGQWRPGTS